MQNRVEILFEKFIKNECSAEEAQQIIELLADENENSAYSDMMLAQLAKKVEDKEISAELNYNLDRILRQIMDPDVPVVSINNKPDLNLRMLYKITAAAVILIMFSFGLIAYLNHKHKFALANNGAKKDIAPGGNKAILTLANGTKVTLDNAANGKIAQQAGVVITKTKSGQILYTISTSKTDVKDIAVAYNTIETPRGGQYQVDLPDGTKVWLNAASSLRYPTRFAGNERRVELHGEGYFEVVKNKKMPFRVETPGQVVEDLGTHFNVEAYADDPASKTTLLEGEVKISKAINGKLLAADASKILRPGEQAVVNENIKIKNVDVDEVVAWKEGVFEFDNEDIGSIMRKVSRWYNVDVEYKGTPTNDGFGGVVSRAKNISAVLHILETTGAVHFKIEGRRIMVLP